MRPEALTAMFCESSMVHHFLFFLNVFRANQMGFEQVSHNLTFKHMTALRKTIQCVVAFFETVFGYKLS